jgi:hypothetical protein
MLAEFASEDRRRMIELAGRTRETMQEFLRRATARKIDRLAALITESFRFLLRKRTLVERVGIDPETFALTLYDRDGHALPRQRLSEGEKQLFAIAMLWGLARASARPLPAVIDTPMARLDATHRSLADLDRLAVEEGPTQGPDLAVPEEKDSGRGSLSHQHGILRSAPLLLCRTGSDTLTGAAGLAGVPALAAGGASPCPVKSCPDSCAMRTAPAGAPGMCRSA